MSKRNIYKECCEEIVKIVTLFPEWKLNDFISDESIDITDGVPFLDSLKRYKAQLELDNHVIQDDDEIEKIISEGMKMNSIFIKKEMYGED